MHTQQFQVTGMTCSACSAHVEKAVKALDGVQEVRVNLLTNSLLLTYDSAKLSPASVIQAVERAGYGASLPREERGEERQTVPDPAGEEYRLLKRRLIYSALAMLPLFYLSMGHMLHLPIPTALHGAAHAIPFAMTQFLLCLCILFLNRSFFSRGIRTLWQRSPTMDSLIALGAGAAVLYSVISMYRIGNALAAGAFALVDELVMGLYFESAGTILTLITLGKLLEAGAKGKTGDAIAGLLRLTPKTAVILREGTEIEVPAKDIVPGDIVLVKTGSAVPIDGVVAQGIGTLDESAITGESLPVEKGEGDALTAGTVCTSGYLQLRATRVGQDTTLSQIIRLVEQASSGKAPIARLADKVSAVFVPVVIAIAIVSALLWLFAGKGTTFSLSVGIAVLVISCPCALGLATPTALMVGMGRGAQRGILYKTAESLEQAQRVDTVVLDKTGTVTRGKPSVTGIYPAENTQEETLLSVACAIELLSEHPLGQAVVEFAKERHHTLHVAHHLEQIPGQGIRAEVDGKTALAGNARMMRENSIAAQTLFGQADKAAQSGQTPLFFARGGRLLGLICIADPIRPHGREAITALRQAGKEVILLTGDNVHTAQAIAAQAGIEQVISEVLPQEKQQKIAALQQEGRFVAMIGDGINDAPALVQADVGIAVGNGTDIAMESADIVLMNSDLRTVVQALALSRATVRNIKQNLFWAFFYNCIGIPLAAGLLYLPFGITLNPMFAAAAMSLSSVFVVSNALRLRLWKPVSITTETEKEFRMKKTMKIDGMSCNHCKGRVEQALNAIEGVSAQVKLEQACAELILTREISDEVLVQAVTAAGYTVVSVE